MNQNATLSPPRQRRGLPLARLRLLAPLLGLALLALSAPPVLADACKGCAGPTLARLKLAAGFARQTRIGAFGTPHKDYYELDRGECVSSAAGPPDIQRLKTWLALRGEGEAWNCPHSKSVDTITVTTSQSDSTAWSFSSSVGFELSAPGAKVKAQVESGKTTGVTITEVTSISKTITPRWCRRIGWKAYFEVGVFRATAKFVHKQRWRWWTKNEVTGASVHAAGDVWMACGTSDITLDRQAPISGYFDLSQKGCTADVCRYILTKHVGVFPTPPPHLQGLFDALGDDKTDSEEEKGSDAPDPTTGDPDEGGNPDDDGNPDDNPDSNGDPDEDDAPEEPLPSSGEIGEPPTGPLPNPFERD